MDLLLFRGCSESKFWSSWFMTCVSVFNVSSNLMYSFSIAYEWIFSNVHCPFPFVAGVIVVGRVERFCGKVRNKVRQKTAHRFAYRNCGPIRRCPPPPTRPFWDQASDTRSKWSEYKYLPLSLVIAPCSILLWWKYLRRHLRTELDFFHIIARVVSFLALQVLECTIHQEWQERLFKKLKASLLKSPIPNRLSSEKTKFGRTD